MTSGTFQQILTILTFGESSQTLTNFITPKRMEQLLLKF